jgi:hypothetical protein
MTKDKEIHCMQESLTNIILPKNSNVKMTLKNKLMLLL